MAGSFVVAFAFAGLAAGCTFSAPEGSDDDGGGGGDVRTLVDDTADDFADPSAVTEVVIHPRGAIEPATYVLGGMQMTAYAQALLTGPTVGWAQLETALQSRKPTGGRLGVPPEFNIGLGRPAGIGLGVNDDFTLVFRGEIYLDAATSFTLESDGPSRVEIDTDGTFSHQLYDDASTNTATRQVTPPMPGWYPIRAALTDTVGDAFFRLRTTNGPILRERLRSQTTTASGLVLDAYDDPLLTTDAGLGLEAVPLMHNFGGTAPTWDLLLQTVTDYSVRMRGQWLADAAGPYRFGATLDSDDWVRIWLDGRVISSRWGPGDTYDASEPLDLAAGWHDLVVDVSRQGGGCSFAIEVLEAPSGVRTGVIMPDRLRPVVRNGLLESRTTQAGLAYSIPDNGTTPISFALSAMPSDAVVQAVDAGFDLNHSSAAQATISLVHPDGTALVLRTNDATNRPFEYYGALTAFAGKSLVVGATPWTLVAADDPAQSGPGGSILNMMLAVSYRAGPAPVASGARFESKPRPLPEGATKIVGARALPAPPAGATVAMSMRTCATAEACASAAWQPVTGELDLPAEAFVEYRLELGSDGWAIPSVDRVEIDYRVE
jgi:hypothetical protein